MKYVSLILILALASCKGQFSNEDQNGNPVHSQFAFQVFCSKFVRINLNDLHHVSSITDYSGRGNAGDRINGTDFLGEMTYKLREYQDGSVDIQCMLNDGGRQYFGTASVSSRNSAYSDNMCSVMYDLEGNGTGGTFYFYWSNTDRGLTYVDDYQNYSKELFVRSSECSEL